MLSYCQKSVLRSIPKNCYKIIPRSRDYDLIESYEQDKPSLVIGSTASIGEGVNNELREPGGVGISGPPTLRTYLAPQRLYIAIGFLEPMHPHCVFFIFIDQTK